MKTISKFFLLCSFFFYLNTNAQAPEKMSYQAVIRNASNNLVSNNAVGMKITIQQYVISWSDVYVETQLPISNQNGLVSIEVGTGNVVSGNFSTIDWSAGECMIKTEVDPMGGTNYTISTTSQLLSVPFALHSKTTKSVNGAQNYIPFFNTTGSIGTSNLYKDAASGFIGLNTISPEANFHIKDNYPSLMLSDYGANKLAANFDLSGNANFGTGSASKLRLITNDFSRLEITANGDVLINKTLQVGSNSRRIGAVEFQTFTIGSSATNTVTTYIPILNGPMPNTNYVVSVTQVNSNDADFFQFIVKNKTVNGFDLYVQRRDANAGWGQNLQIDYAVICGQ
jgi:hypothetical protein